MRNYRIFSLDTNIEHFVIYCWTMAHLHHTVIRKGYMIITCNIRTGNFDEVFESLCASISWYARNSPNYKIGITANPETRSDFYGNEYDEMILLYRTSSERYVRAMERKLIDRFSRTIDNLIGGGGGRLGSGPYYLYIARTWL